MLIVRDDFDASDFPVFVGGDESLEAAQERENAGAMQRVIAVYALPVD